VATMGWARLQALERGKHKRLPVFHHPSHRRNVLLRSQLHDSSPLSHDAACFTPTDTPAAASARVTFSIIHFALVTAGYYKQTTPLHGDNFGDDDLHSVSLRTYISSILRSCFWNKGVSATTFLGPCLIFPCFGVMF
jgi:hypothetical protein